MARAGRRLRRIARRWRDVACSAPEAWRLSQALVAVVNRIDAYVGFVEARGARVAYLCDGFEAASIIATGMRRGTIPETAPVVCRENDPPAMARGPIAYDAAWSDDVDALVVPRLLEHDDEMLAGLWQDLRTRKPGLVLFDQAPAPGGTWRMRATRRYRYRNLRFTLRAGTVIPSYYANCQFLDLIVAHIRRHRVRTMLDLCAGQGVLGLTCWTEPPGLERLSLADINADEVAAIKDTVIAEGLDASRITPVVSDGLSAVPPGTYDLIVANPPHQDAAAPSLMARQGSDPGWSLHRGLFEGAPRVLSSDGRVMLLENGRPDYATPELISELAAPWLATELVWRIPATEWFVVTMKAHRDAGGA